MSKAKQPIIIIGMHRSGTSMITRFIQEIDYFLGDSLDINHEANYFIRLNEWILRQTNSTWDNPYNFKFLPLTVEEHLKKVCEQHLEQHDRVKYLGLKNYFSYSNIKNIDFNWGWKDPRNSITLPIWKSIFPNAKIIHIYRNPFDVAISLYRREIDYEANYNSNLISKFKEFFLYPNHVGYSFSVRTTKVDEGIKLWTEYMQYIERYKLMYDYFEIKYEDFLDNPVESLKSLSSYLDVDVHESKYIEIAGKVNSDRKYSFLNDQDMLELYKEKYKFDQMVKSYGYGDLA
ncbi:MAG: sulfotransferase [Campylobacterales bacterium]|nr:sulfotransferase [Campylobacterales bacterium]